MDIETSLVSKTNHCVSSESQPQASRDGCFSGLFFSAGLILRPRSENTTLQMSLAEQLPAAYRGKAIRKNTELKSTPGSIQFYFPREKEQTSGKHF